MANFKKPSFLTNEKITEIQDELLNVQTKIDHLNSVIEERGNTQQLGTRLSSIENDFYKLQQQLSDKSRNSVAANGRNDAAFAKLTNHCNLLDKQLKDLQISIKHQKEAQLPAKIVDSIRCHKFSDAESLINELNDYEIVRKIVNGVYNNCQGNVDVLLDCAKALTKVDIRWYVLSSLRYEMKSNGHCNPYKMMSLVKTLQSELLSQNSIHYPVKVEVEETIDDIKRAVTDTFKLAMYSGNYKKDIEVDALSEAVYDFRADVYCEVMKMVVDEMYTKLSAEIIADNIYSNRNIERIVVGLFALFRKLEANNDLNNKAVLIIGFYFKKLMAMQNYKNISSETKQYVKSVIAAMPICARNLFSAKKVCLWNRGTEEYLYAADFNFSEDRRRVFTWHSKERVRQCYWIAEFDGNLVHFQNTRHSNEYLYAAEIQPLFNKQDYYVFTWIPGGRLYPKSAWIVELDGDYCYLKNQFFDEYLYASNNKHDSERRNPFIWKSGTSVRQQKFQWQIRSGD